MAARVPPKTMAKKLVRILRPQHPDYHYLKKVFQHTRDLLAVGPAPRPKRLPALLTEAELVALYEAIWHAQQLTHLVMLKLLLYTGIRNAELGRFTVDRLMSILNRLGSRIEVKVRVRRAEGIREIPLGALRAGDVVLVSPGGLIAVDGGTAHLRSDLVRLRDPEDVSIEALVHFLLAMNLRLRFARGEQQAHRAASPADRSGLR